jgi:non-homologous end joining protein Ku
MAPRANWKGYLRLSLVSGPIALYPASSLSEKVTTTVADPNVTLQLQKNCEKLAVETFHRETAMTKTGSTTERIITPV